MLVHPPIQAGPGLAQGLAQLRESTAAIPAPFWLPGAVHALILACLARIFGRLENLIALWQSGTLPSPPVPRATTPRASAARTRNPRRRAPRPRAKRRAASEHPDSVHTPHREPAPRPAPAPKHRSTARDPPISVETTPKGQHHRLR